METAKGYFKQLLKNCCEADIDLLPQGGRPQNSPTGHDNRSEEEGTCPFCGRAARGRGACGRCAGLLAGAGIGPGFGPGAGPGAGPGRGPKGKHDPDTEQSPTRVKGDLTPGDIIGAIQFKTLPAKGEVKSSYAEAFQRASAEEAEALQQIEIPPGYRLHVRDYFDSIRPDKPDKPDKLEKK